MSQATFDRRAFLKSAAGGLLSGGLLGAAPARRPNIIVILADDLGYKLIKVGGKTELYDLETDIGEPGTFPPASRSW